MSAGAEIGRATEPHSSLHIHELHGRGSGVGQGEVDEQVRVGRIRSRPLERQLRLERDVDLELGRVPDLAI